MVDLFYSLQPVTPPRCIRAVGAGSTQFRLWSNGMCSYRYMVEGSGFMEFSMLSEVGERYKADFARIFREFNVVIEPGGLELPHKPYISDKLISMLD